MRRRVVFYAATAIAIVLTLLAWHARSGARAKLVRVGGSDNPCACTHRIEP